jgi:16S rRNA (cytosine1402-N4)-methyltransferase
MIIAQLHEERINQGEAVTSAEPMSRHHYHESVLLRETVDALQPVPGAVIVDCTLGGGGHTEALLQAGARVIGLDQDPDAISFASNRLIAFGDQFTPVRSSFSELRARLDELGIEEVDGILLDLGVSSHQLDTPERGFSFQREGPLDMRMDPTSPVTAAALVNTMSAEQLERIFKTYGEEPAARKIAARIVRDRMVAPFETTLQLAQAVESVVPRRGKTHPATRVFQSLRLAVNRELDILPLTLEQATASLRPGGRLAVITFHSLEDRIVKHFLKERATEWLDRPEWPAPRRNPAYVFRLLSNKAIVASEEEERTNPRSRSAKLRAAEKISKPR